MFLPAVSGTSAADGAQRSECRCIQMPKAIASLSGASNFAAKARNKGRSLSFSRHCRDSSSCSRSSFCRMNCRTRGSGAGTHGDTGRDESSQRCPRSQLAICGIKRPCSFCQLSDALERAMADSSSCNDGSCPLRRSLNHAIRAKPLASFRG